MTQKIIGFDRKLDIEWLDAAAALAASLTPSEEARSQLGRLLGGNLANQSHHGAVYKTTTVLRRIWIDPFPQAEAVRDDALGLLGDVDADERLALHWAVVAAAYPFFCDVMGAIGRMLTLQDSVSLNLVTRRMVEGWGSRSTLPRAIQRVVRSAVQWGILADGPEKGLYTSSRQQTLLPRPLEILLVETMLLASGQESNSFDQLAGHPALFPFCMTITPTDLRGANRLEVHRQGLDMDILEFTHRAGRG